MTCSNEVLFGHRQEMYGRKSPSPMLSAYKLHLSTVYRETMRRLAEECENYRSAMPVGGVLSLGNRPTIDIDRVACHSSGKVFPGVH